MICHKYTSLQQACYSYNDFEIETINASYMQLIREWRNEQMEILRQSETLTEEMQETYFNEVIFPELEKLQPEQVLFNYYDAGKFIGYGGIVHISWLDKLGEISFLLDPALTRGEYYEKAFSSFLHLMDIIAFEQLHLDKLFTETYETRKINVPIIESCGFKQEGVQVAHKIINGKRCNVYLHGKLNTALQ